MIKILVADDNPDILKTLEARLRANQMDVVTASDCDQAIKKAYSENPDLIIMDIRMPAVGGLNAMESLKMFSRTQSIPVIFITAYPGKEVEARVYELGAADFIAKPFATEELLTKIHNALRRAKSDAP
jgi:DNA-binding response OmpR family regulator